MTARFEDGEFFEECILGSSSKLRRRFHSYNRLWLRAQMPEIVEEAIYDSRWIDTTSSVVDRFLEVYGKAEPTDSSIRVIGPDSKTTRKSRPQPVLSRRYLPKRQHRKLCVHQPGSKYNEVARCSGSVTVTAADVLIWR
jgi:hypothetical protein